jgi:hypothetical protein
LKLKCVVLPWKTRRLRREQKRDWWFLSECSRTICEGTGSYSHRWFTERRSHRRWRLLIPQSTTPVVASTLNWIIIGPARTYFFRNLLFAPMLNSRTPSVSNLPSSYFHRSIWLVNAFYLDLWILSIWRYAPHVFLLNALVALNELSTQHSCIKYILSKIQDNKSINIGLFVWVVLPSVTTCVRVSWMFGYQSGGKNWTLLPTMDTYHCLLLAFFSNNFILK